MSRDDLEKQLEQINNLPLSDEVKEAAKKDIMKNFTPEENRENGPAINDFLGAPGLEKTVAMNIVENEENSGKNQGKTVKEGTTSNNKTREDFQAEFESYKETIDVLKKEGADYVGGDPIISGKHAIIAKKNGKQFIIWGKEKYSDDFDYVGFPANIGGIPAFKAYKDGKSFIMRGKEKYSDDFDRVYEPTDIGGKPAFAAEKDGKYFIMWGKEKYSEDFDNMWGPVNVGGKPAFRVCKDGKWFIMWGKEKYSEDFDNIASGPREWGGKPAFIAIKNGKELKIGFEGSKILHKKTEK